MRREKDKLKNIECSSLGINITKCKAMQVGSLRDKNVTFGLFPCVKTVYVLGIDMSYDNEVYTRFFKQTII